MPAPVVAQRKTKAPNGLGCMICSLPLESLQAMNEAIWDGTQDRVKNYRQRGLECFLLITGKELDLRTVTRHAEHVEATWHTISEARPQRSTEVPVFSSDYESLTDAAAGLSAKAMGKLTEKIDRDQLGDRDLISAAKLGVTARAQQRATEVASKQPKIELTAIFGLASGHLASLPESEALDVTPEGDLLDEVHAEKAALEAHARGT